jgi:hypothetical protein
MDFSLDERIQLAQAESEILNKKIFSLYMRKKAAADNTLISMSNVQQSETDFAAAKEYSLNHMLDSKLPNLESYTFELLDIKEKPKRQAPKRRSI